MPRKTKHRSVSFFSLSSYDVRALETRRSAVFFRSHREINNPITEQLLNVTAELSPPARYRRIPDSVSVNLDLRRAE